MSFPTILRSAVDDGHGQVDAGYLAIAGAFVIVLGAIPIMCAMAFVEVLYSTTHHTDLQQLGIGIGSVCTGFGAVCGAVGVFRWGDRNGSHSAGP